MKIFRAQYRMLVCVVAMATASCAPLTGGAPSGSSANRPSDSTVPVLHNGPAKRWVKPSAIGTAVNAAELGQVSPGTGKEIDAEEHGLRQALAKVKGTEVSRRKGLLVIRLRGEAGFDSGSAAIGQGLYTAVEKIAAVLLDHPRSVLQVEGHTDSQGSDAYNLDLSQRRAEAVTNLLAQLGMNSTHLEAVGFGESHPLAANSDEAGRRQNRRIEIKLAPAR